MGVAFRLVIAERRSLMWLTSSEASAWKSANVVASSVSLPGEPVMAPGADPCRLAATGLPEVTIEYRLASRYSRLSAKFRTSEIAGVAGAACAKSLGALINPADTASAVAPDKPPRNRRRLRRSTAR